MKLMPDQDVHATGLTPEPRTKSLRTSGNPDLTVKCYKVSYSGIAVLESVSTSDSDSMSDFLPSKARKQ